MPGFFQNFIAGEQAGLARNQQQFQNQFALRQQQMAEQEFAQKQAALEEDRNFNQLAAQSFGTDVVQTLGVPLTGGPPAQALGQSAFAQPQAPIDESQGPPQYPQGQALPQVAPSAPQGPDPLSRLIAMNPERAFKLQEAQAARSKLQSEEIYNLSTSALRSKSPATTLKYILSADKVGTLPTKAIRQALIQQGFDVDNLDDARARPVLERWAQQSAIGAGIAPKEPQSTDDIREYEYAKRQGYNGTFDEFVIAMKRAGAANTNVNLPGNKYPNAFQEGLAKADVQRLEKYQQQAEGATEMVKTLDQLKELSATALAGGTAEKRANIANWIQGLTGIDVIDPTVLANTQNYNALISKAVIDRLGGSLGTGVSNSDVTFIKETVGKLENSKEAREALIAYLRMRAVDQVDLYDRAREYAERPGNLGLKGFDRNAKEQLKTKQKTAKRDYSKATDDDLRKELGL